MFFSGSKPQENTTVEKSVSMNTTVNGSLPSFWNCSSLINPEARKIGATVSLSLSLVFSLVGNCLIILIVYKTPTLRKPINLLIANMAMSDLLHPTFLFPVLLAEMHVGSWFIGGTLGQAFCKLCYFLANASGLVSIQSLVLIAVDRFGAVVLPLRSPLITRKLCLFFIIATWITATAVSSPFLVANKVVKYRERLMCVSLWKKIFGGTFANYILAVIVVVFFIPFVLVVVLYSIICMKLNMQVHPGEQSANAKEQRNRRNRNVLKMAIAIVVVFFVCCMPYLSNNLIVFLSAPHSSILFSCRFFLYYIVSKYVFFTNSAINPIICFVFSGNYRQALKRLVNCCDTVQD